MFPARAVGDDRRRARTRGRCDGWGMARFLATMNATVEGSRGGQLGRDECYAIAASPVARILAGEPSNPLLQPIFHRHQAFLLLAFTAGQLALILTAVTTSVLSDWAGATLSRMASVLAVMVSAVQFAPARLSA